MASYVFVWEQNMYLQKEIGGREWPGHSSMNIGDHFDSGSFTPTPGQSWDETMAARDAWLKTLSRNYVSYWPATAGATFGAADVFGKRSRSTTKFSVADDIKAEGYLPDWVIELDTDANEERAMLAEWATIRDKPKSTYGAFKKNCSTIVSRVLQAGGFYAKKWAVNCNWVWAPGDVRRLALKVGGQPLTWAQFAPVLTAGIPPSAYGFKDFSRDAAYNNVGAPSKFNFGTKVAGVGGNPIPG
jgi:hypothetical protein